MLRQREAQNTHPDAPPVSFQWTGPCNCHSMTQMQAWRHLHQPNITECSQAGEHACCQCRICLLTKGQVPLLLWGVKLLQPGPLQHSLPFWPGSQGGALHPQPLGRHYLCLYLPFTAGESKFRVFRFFFPDQPISRSAFTILHVDRCASTTSEPPSKVPRQLLGPKSHAEK